MNVKPKPICFVCLSGLESNKFSTSRVCGDDEDGNGSEFDLYIKFIKFATNSLKIPSTTFKKFLSITNADNGSKIFCEKCRKTVQTICSSYLELIQVQLRLSWKLGELEKLMENTECSGSESDRIEGLAHNLGIDDVTSVEKIRELLSVRCEHMSQKFQPQLVLSRYETLPASSSHSQSGQIIKKEVNHRSENSDNDWCPPDEDEIVSNASTSPPSCSQMKYHVILMNNQIKMEDVDNKFEVDAEQEEENQDSDSSSDCSSAGEEDPKKIPKSGSRALKKGAAQTTFSCEVEGCLNEFETHLELNSHLKTHSQEVLYCQVCGWGFIDPNLLKLHELVHVKSTKVAGKRLRQFLCPESNCVLGFATTALLQDHYNIRHGIALKRFKCKQCEHAATSSRALKVHVHFMHNKSNTRPKRKPRPNQKWRPVKPGPRQCVPCGLQLNNKTALFRHRRRLHLKRVCGICSEAFKGELALKKHLILTHPEISKVDLKFPCLICRKAFPTMAKLELHNKSCQQFQQQLVLSHYETLPSSSSHSQSDQNMEKGVEHLSENSENDWCPPGEDETVSKDSTSPSSCSRMKYRVILMDNKIKMEDDDNEFEADGEQEGDNQDSESSLDCSSAGEKNPERKTKSGSRARKKHAEKGTVPCEINGCQNRFENHLELNSHLKTHSQEVLYCQNCGWGFIDPNLLKLHELVHLKPTIVAGNRGKQILCPESNCVLTFDSIAMLQNHYNIRHGVSLKRFSCSECLHVSTSSSALREHKNIHHLGKPKKGRQLPKKNMRAITVSCEVVGCPEEFKSHLKLNSHLKTHSESISFCKDCGFGFINMNLLKLHELTHLKSVKADGMTRGMYYCPEPGCSLKINSIAKLQDHFNTRHGVSLKRFQCQQCEHAATSSRALQVHVRDMHNESNIKQKRWPVKPGPRQCGPCGLQFNNKSALIRHRRRLHLRRVCEICNEAFTGNLELKKHLILTHPEVPKKVEKVELKFPCLSCTKAFPTVAKLELHKRSSHGEKVHECAICHKLFRTSFLVTDHRIKYHDSKPCLHCGKTFAGSQALRRHILSYHLDKTSTEVGRHECPHCTLRYNLKIYMYRHIWNCHPDAPENLKCSTCEFKVECGMEKVMEQHELTHMTEEERKLQRKVNICHFCGEEFSKLVDFNKHVSAHDEIK